MATVNSTQKQDAVGPKFRIELPGNQILGDGKLDSDNQNHITIFYRGEYLQPIDTNQDNYLERMSQYPAKCTR